MFNSLSSKLTVLTISFCVMFGAANLSQGQEIIRVGIVGCDTSHVIAFTKLINAEGATGDLSKIRVVAAFAGGSDDIPSSYERVGDFVKQLKELEIEMVPDLSSLRSKCDAYLLESVDGRTHLSQFQIIAEGKPVFIDKPAAGSLRQLLDIIEIAEKTKTPIFSSSALRFCQQVHDIQKAIPPEEIQAVEACSPYKTEPHHPDLFWYGIHGVESMYAILGIGCQTVQCVEGNQCVATGLWKNGQTGTFRGIKTPSDSQAYRVTGFGEKTIETRTGFSGYEPLVQEIATFLVSRRPPVNMDETIEMFAFMEAADESKRNGGIQISIQAIIERAKKVTK